MRHVRILQQVFRIEECNENVKYFSKENAKEKKNWWQIFPNGKRNILHEINKLRNLSKIYYYIKILQNEKWFVFQAGKYSRKYYTELYRRI